MTDSLTTDRITPALEALRSRLLTAELGRANGVTMDRAFVSDLASLLEQCRYMQEELHVSLRDRMAMAALQGGLVGAHHGGFLESMTREAYMIADAMLAARSK